MGRVGLRTTTQGRRLCSSGGGGCTHGERVDSGLCGPQEALGMVAPPNTTEDQGGVHLGTVGTEAEGWRQGLGPSELGEAAAGRPPRRG